jgi:ribosome-binding protein aMBF1 (putative translation factor)
VCEYPHNRIPAALVRILTHLQPGGYCVNNPTAIAVETPGELMRTMLVRSADDLGAAIAEARRLKGLTQEQLAAQSGIERTYLARLEAGASTLLLTRSLQLLRRLGAEVIVNLPESVPPVRAADGNP